MTGFHLDYLIPKGVAVARRCGLSPSEIDSAVREAVARAVPGFIGRVDHERQPGRFGAIRVLLEVQADATGFQRFQERFKGEGALSLRQHFQDVAESIAQRENAAFDWRSFRVTEIPLRVEAPMRYYFLDAASRIDVLQRALLRAIPAFRHNGIRGNFELERVSLSDVSFRLLLPTRLDLSVEDLRSGRSQLSATQLELGSDSLLSREIAREMDLRQLLPHDRNHLVDVQVEVPAARAQDLSPHDLRLLTRETLRAAYPGLPAEFGQFVVDYDRSTHRLNVIVALPRAEAERLGPTLREAVAAQLGPTLYRLSHPSGWARHPLRAVQQGGHDSGDTVTVELEATLPRMVQESSMTQTALRAAAASCFPELRGSAMLDTMQYSRRGNRALIQLEVPRHLAPPLYGKVADRLEPLPLEAPVRMKLSFPVPPAWSRVRERDHVRQIT